MSVASTIPNLGDSSWWLPYQPGSSASNNLAHYYQTEPTTCIGKAHVFECEHVKTCQCGKVERVMDKAKTAKKRGK